MPAPSPLDPSQTSSDYKAQEREWQLISAIMGGVEEMRRHCGERLPKYEAESYDEYRRRKECAPWRPEFTDILQTLASKPFGRDVAIKGVVPDAIVGRLDPASGMRLGGLVDDIDGTGRSLTTFAREAFLKGCAKGAHAIYVTYPPMPANASRAEEIAAGARPYWNQIAVEDIIALYTEVQGAREVITHARIRGSRIERNGYAERTIQSVLILEPGTAEVFEQQPDGVWLSQGVQPMMRGGKHTSVPLVLFLTGERLGPLRVRPPLADLAQLQCELWNALSRQDEILTYAGSPMLAAIGVSKPSGAAGYAPIEVGPKTILFAPPVDAGVRTAWEYIQPDAANIKEIREHVQAIQLDMRRIGMQPLTEQPGNPSATGQSIAAAKAHSQVKAWACLLNDAIEQAMVFTCEYLGLPATVQTEVSTDFGVLPYAQFPLQSLDAARDNRDISRKAYLENLKRFDVLPADFDDAADAAQISTEGAPPPVVEDVTVAVEPDTRPRAVRRREARKAR